MTSNKLSKISGATKEYFKENGLQMEEHITHHILYTGATVAVITTPDEEKPNITQITNEYMDALFNDVRQKVQEALEFGVTELNKEKGEEVVK